MSTGARIFLSPPWLGGTERACVSRAFDSGYIAPCGPMVDALEKRLADLARVPDAAAVSSGTAAIDLLMHELRVGPGSVVLCSDLTFVSSIAPAVHRGATPVFVDADPATGTISLPLLEQALLDAPKPPAAVVAADLYGQCCDYDALEKLCARFAVPLVIDAAEALGASSRGRPAGCAGFASLYSFNGNKMITTSGGGAVLSRDPAIVARARQRSQQSREPVAWYEHRELGYNYRMSNILAALGLGQLDALPEILRRKRAVHEFYQEALRGLAIPFPCDDAVTDSSRWLSVFLFHSRAAREAAAARCGADNVEARPVWNPMHRQPVFANAKVYGGTVSTDFFDRGLCLPSGAGLKPDDLARIVRDLRG